jgi:NADPH:quinone reductase-like Zn-dependent oxidoreductase
MSATEVRSFQSRKTNLADAKVVTTTLNDPAPGEVLVRVEHFALTANNITYGVAGDTIGYWNFFPGEGDYGCIPVWGFGVIERSAHADLSEGTRLYGYFPMATHVMLKPGNVEAFGFSDSVEHRSGLPPIYNQYLITSADPGYRRDAEAEQMLYRPLFTTSFLIDDFLNENDFFAAGNVILTSASSKTSIGLAQLLSKRPGIKVIGLTSAGNVKFVEGLGCYDLTVSYDDIEQLPQEASVLVDMAGSSRVRAAVHNHLADQLAHSSAVGATHWQDATVGGGAQDLPGPAPTMFFAPSQAQRRIKDLGRGGFEAALATAWQSFLAAAQDWISVEQHHGEAELAAVYQDFLDGKADPAKGYVMAL